nr:hypothetical protein [Tissierella sp.]
MSLNKIVQTIKQWNNKKNKTDIKYSNDYESTFYYKNSDVNQALNEVNTGNIGRGIQY